MIQKLLSLLALACLTVSPNIVAQEIISHDSLRKLGSVVEHYIQKNYAMGAELQVIQNGETLFHQSYGLSDKESSRPWENDTICNIRSMTKPITSAAAQILIDRQLLDLEQPVASYLESFNNDESGSITVRQILTHRSGLPLTNLTHPYQYKSLSEQVAAAGTKGPEFEPDSKFWYSDTGTDVVAAVVEKVSGEPIHEFVQREIFDPLGMTNSLYGFSKTDERLSRAASAYMNSPKGWRRFWKPDVRPLYPFAWGSQTVYTTTSDYARFLRMLMNEGRVGDRQILSPARVDRMQHPVSVLTMMGSDNVTPTGFRNLETWYGQMMVTYHVRGVDKEKPVIFGHSGSDGTNSWAWPERDLVILYFTQSRGGMTPLRIEESIDALIINPDLKEEIPDQFRPYVGTYIANYDDFENEEFTVKVWGGRLVLDVPTQLAFELIEPDENGQWAFAIAPQKIHVTFDRNKSDEVIGLRMNKGGRVFDVPRKGRVQPDKPSNKVDPGKDAQTTTWRGTLDTGRQQLRLEIDIVRDGETLTGETRSLDQNNATMAADEITADGETLSFSNPAVGASFTGKISADGLVAEGTFTQNGNSIPLTLTRSDAKQQTTDDQPHNKPLMEELREAWYGNLEIGAARPVMQFRIVTRDPDETTAWFDSITEGQTGFPATWSIDGDRLNFDVEEIQLTYRGTLNEQQNVATGTWSQGGRDFPLTLKKHNTAYDDKPIGEPDDLEQRLETLDKLLESERIKHRIPGLAIAIVKNDEIIFSRGYGHRDLESRQPVETDTLFAIGSSTKAFTGTLVGMLVDEGKMQWDDPVTRHLPHFTMKVDTGDDQITIRDLLCHRTGYTRMGVLWASGELSSDEVIRQAAQAEPYAEFRKKFLYNNVMFMTAGRCAGQAAGSDWDTLIADRIFSPLGMNSSSTQLDHALNDPRLSRGYMWDNDKKAFEHLAMRKVDSVGPSGSIVSNVKDMARWLRFQLSGGQFNDQKLISDNQLAETWNQQMKMSRSVGYGFGWMLRKWNGVPVVEHGGSIDGFAAQVTLLPEYNTGYVLLANVTATPLQQQSINLVFDTLFGETTEHAESGESSSPDVDTGELIGNYIGNFGPFNNKTMRILTQNGSLAIDVPGQRIFELKSPDDEGKWYFADTDSIAIAFHRDDTGKAVFFTLHQNGAAPEFLREGIVRDPESPAAVTAPLLGKYREPESGKTIEVVLRNGRLTIDAGRSAFELALPDDKGNWAMRARPERLQVRFKENEDGTIQSLSRIERGTVTEMLRVDEPPSDKAGKLETLIARTRAGFGSPENANVQGIRFRGTASFVHQGASGTVDSIISMTGQYSTRQEFGKMATMVFAYDGQSGFFDSNASRYKELTGRSLKQLKLNHPLWFLGDWTQDYPEVTFRDGEKIDGKDTFVLSLTGASVADRSLVVEAATGLIVKESTVVSNDAAGDIPIEITYSDFRDVNGIKLPFRSVTENPMMGEIVIQYETAESLTELPEDAFDVSPLSRK